MQIVLYVCVCLCMPMLESLVISSLLLMLLMFCTVANKSFSTIMGCTVHHRYLLPLSLFFFISPNFSLIPGRLLVLIVVLCKT